MTRRELLRIAGLGGAFLAADWTWLESAAAAAAAPTNPAAAQYFGLPASPYVEPELRRAAAGHLRTQLRVSYAPHQIGRDKVLLRSYERALVGPTLRFRAGDVVEIDLINQLPVEPGGHAAHGAAGAGHGAHQRNGPHGINVTNLHVHGLHVSPAGQSDNVFLQVPPGARQRYRFEIPKNHPAGTYYYHPHKHGSTAVQIGNGMSGALIVEGDVDQLPALRAARERLMVLQQIPYHRKTGKVEWREVSFEDVRTPTTTINGRLKPRIDLRPGEVQRWRLVHAGVKTPLAVSLVDAKGNPLPLHQIACDGITTGRIEPLTEIELGPGNRVDVLVQIPREGAYYLMNREVLLRNLPIHRQLLADVAVAGPRAAQRMPEESELAALVPRKTLARAANPGKQRVELWLDGDHHKVDGKVFDPRSRPRQLKLGKIDEWTVKVVGSGINIHPFHLHTNPFEVLSINGKRLAQPIWRDTLLIGSPTSIFATKEAVFRMQYLDFTGRSMLHCHNAVHEDMGMMQIVEVLP